MESNYNDEIRKKIAISIPCVHMNTILIGERVLNTFSQYLNDLKEKGFTNIDEVLEDMKNKNGQPGIL